MSARGGRAREDDDAPEAGDVDGGAGDGQLRSGLVAAEGEIGDDERVRRAFVEKILRNTSRLSALARDLTEIARIETGELRMTMGPFALARAVDETLEALEPVAAARHVPDGLLLTPGLEEVASVLALLRGEVSPQAPAPP